MATKFPSSLASVESVSNVERRGARWNFEIAGVQAWCCEFSQGLCVALSVECKSLDDAWVEKASLWLASVRGGIDDAFSIEEDRLWLVRRYETELASAEWELRLNQQLAIANWLTGRHARTEAIAQAGKVGTWA
jgi:hypothetical protein